MENLAYLHVASVYEAAENTVNPIVLRGWSLSSLPKIRLLTLILTFAVLSTAQAALALEPGNSGSEVSDLQTQLRDAGYYNGPISGFYGPLTKDAVSNFQQAQGLSVDGIAGSQTLSALQNLRDIETTSTGNGATDNFLRRGASGPEVTTLQNNLRIAGYYNGPNTEYFGSLTEEAVIRFQRDNGLVADGIVGSATRSKLYNVGGAAPFTQAFNDFPQPNNTDFLNTYDNLGAYDNASPTLIGLNDRSPAVTNLQARLRELRYYREPITGYFDEATRDAVIRFQRDRGLTPDGIVGPNTLSALQSNQPRDRQTTTANRAAEKFSVLELQKRLKARGFNPGPLDGAMGPSTRSAIAAAQQFYGISRDDVVGGRF